MIYLNIFNPDNSDYCYVILNEHLDEKLINIFFDRIFDEKFKVYESNQKIIKEEKENGSIFVWDFHEVHLNTDKLQRMIDELKWVNTTRITFDKNNF